MDRAQPRDYSFIGGDASDGDVPAVEGDGANRKLPPDRVPYSSPMVQRRGHHRNSIGNAPLDLQQLVQLHLAQDK